MRFDKKTAIVTGGGGSIGGATAKMLAEEGCSVLVCDYDFENAAAVCNEISKKGGVAVPMQVNVKSSVEADAAVAKAMELWGQIDILVCSAGGSARELCAPLIDQTDEVIQNMIGINLYGVIWFNRAAAREMVKRRYGKIINVASTVGTQGRKHMAEYSAAKGGVIAMTKTLAIELGKSNINVNAVSPGVVPRESGHNWNSQSVMDKTAVPEDIGGMILYLASDAANFCTGANYLVDGGNSLGVLGISMR
ncbi:SDR family NAD(P)-dependent oxidoreductase [Paenibacillus hemerocallicola]|nr:SDR family oxidoreductase [Paenibacillus hemerocallicola]